MWGPHPLEAKYSFSNLTQIEAFFSSKQYLRWLFSLLSPRAIDRLTTYSNLLWDVLFEFFLLKNDWSRSKARFLVIEKVQSYLSHDSHTLVPDCSPIHFRWHVTLALSWSKFGCRRHARYGLRWGSMSFGDPNKRN